MEGELSSLVATKGRCPAGRARGGLEAGVRIEYVDLRANALRDDGCAALAEGLRHAHRLKVRLGIWCGMEGLARLL